MYVGDYTFEYSTVKVKMSTSPHPQGKLNWYARRREPNTFELWEMKMAWEMNVPDGMLAVFDEEEILP